MKRSILDISDLQEIVPQLNNERGAKILQRLVKICKIDDINALYGRHCDLRGVDFVSAIIDDLDISCKIDNEEVLNHLPEGSFVTISNHPFGALDGVIIIKLIAAHRPDYKVMVNWILNYIQAMSDNFIAVDPYSNPERRYVSLNGIREALMQAKNGHPLGFFPAGAVSRLKWSLKIEDREWQPNIIRLIQQIKKPVIPVFFHGHNSLFYNLLGLISWKLRAMRLPAEVFKKEHQTIHVSFGDIIPPETLAQYRTTEELGAFLRHETDKLRKPKSRL